MISKLFDNKLFLLALLLVITLGVYYPVLSAKLVNLDDTEMIMDLNDPEIDYSFENIFFIKDINRYYRPLLFLTFIIDSKIWWQAPSGYHLTNYLLHAFNAVFLFFIALKLFEKNDKRELIAFISAVLFAVHPLTCESTAWISGRSDILSTFFCLLALFFYLSTRIKFRIFFIILSVFLGLLSKENTLSVIPIILTIHFFKIHAGAGNWKKAFMSTTGWGVLLLLPLIAYMYLRTNGLDNIDHGFKVAMTDKVSSDTVKGYTGKKIKEDKPLVYYIAATTGFYYKKLFFPYPLNLAINKIDIPFYAGVFILLIIISSALIIMKNKYVIWLALVFWSFAPAIPVATSKMAWMPFAERYLYLSVAIWALALGDIFLNVTSRPDQLLPKISLFIFIALVAVVFATTTFQRTFAWHDSLAIWTDTYKKSPDSGKVLYKYGIELGNPAGTKILRKAVETARDDEWKDFSLLALAKRAAREGKNTVAENYIDRALKIRSYPNNYYTAASIMVVLTVKTPGKKEIYVNRTIEYYRKAYDIDRKPFALYQIAKLYVSLGKLPEAINSLGEIITMYPFSQYAAYARTLKETLEKKL